MNICRIICLVCLSASIGFSVSKTGIAQNRPLNPLETEIDKSDPVIPLGYKKRDLSTFEINRIKREMEKLDRQAKVELQQGKVNKAFKLWYRQLKLARAAGKPTEIQALGEVGAIAWQANRGADLRNIANRLIAIELEIEAKDPIPALLEQFAIAYQQVRYLDRAISIREQTLAQNKQQGDSLAVEKNLQTLGNLYLSQFNYQAAAKIYEQLITQAQAKSPIDPEIDFYLKTSIDIYERTGQTKRAIEARQRLITGYETTGKQDKIPQLELANASDYEVLDKTVKATETYESAFNLATKNLQLAIAEEALDNLSKLYQREGKGTKAIATLNRLLDVQRQSYNYYGLINTYDTLGKIHLKSAKKQRAKQYFQQALELARELDYKINYFNNQIEKL